MSTSASRSELPLTLAEQVDSICERFEAEWIAGRRPDVAAFVAGATTDARRALAVELIRVDLVYRRKLAETPRPSDYLGHVSDVDEATIASLVDDAMRTIPHGDTLRQIEPTPPPRPAQRLEPVGRFRPVSFHARGGLGEVHVAEDDELPRRVALKRIQPERANNSIARARFIREAEITSLLEHPGIVPVYGLVTGPDDQPSYAMRFVEGKNLHVAIDRLHAMPSSPDRDLEFRQLLGRFIAVCNAVAFAHSKGVIHRDLKPQNVMLGEYGETYVVDWGLAKRIGDIAESDAESLTSEPDLSLAGAALGTPAYMSPEQARGEPGVDTRSDIYGLGAILYQLLSGTRPFAGRSADEIAGALSRNESPEPLGRVPPALAAVCRKAMASNSTDRYPSAGAVAAEVERWLADEPVAAYAEPVRVKVGRWARRHRTIVATLLTAAFVGCGVLALWSIEANRKQQRDMVFECLRASSTAKDRGDWQTVLEQSDRAVALGHVPTPEMVLDRVQAWNGLNEAGNAHRELVSLDSRSDLGPAQGRYDLYRGIARLGAFQVEAEALLRSAATSATSDADRDYARALLAEDTVTALSFCQKSLKADRFHQDARGTGGLLLALLGRFPEAQILAEESASLFPRSPAFPTLLLVMDALQGRKQDVGDRLQTLRSKLAPEHIDALAAAAEVLELWRDTFQRELIERKPLPTFQAAVNRFKLLSAFGRIRSALEPNPADAEPGMRGAPGTISALLSGLRVPPMIVRPFQAVFAHENMQAILQGAGASNTSLDRLREVLKPHPEGSIWFLCGLLHLQDQRFMAFDTSFLRSTAAVFEQAAMAPSMIPVHDAAQEFRLLAECMICLPPNPKPDPSMRPVALAHLRECIGRAIRGPHIATPPLALAIESNELALARLLLTDADRQGNPVDEPVRLKFYMKDGQYGQVIEWAKSALKKNPSDKRAKELLTEAQQKIRDVLQSSMAAP